MEKVCLYCKKSFYRNGGTIKSWMNRKVCSMVCWSNFRKSNGEGMKKYNCRVCKKEIIDFPSKVRSTCSVECRSKIVSKCVSKRNVEYPHRGFKMPPITNIHKQRMSEKRKLLIAQGKIKTIFQPGVSIFVGKNHWNWKGGITPISIRLRGTLKLKEWRNKIFSRDNFTCQECGIRGGYLEADHIKSWSKYPELRFDLNNGRTLCRPCHIKSPNFGSKSWTR